MVCLKLAVLNEKNTKRGCSVSKLNDATKLEDINVDVRMNDFPVQVRFDGSKSIDMAMCANDMKSQVTVSVH